MQMIAQPATAEDLAECVRAAHAEGLALTPWGAGTLQHLGRPPLPEATRLDISGLGRVLEHTPADLTISVEAGATLAGVQVTLREHGQWLPWAPPAPPEATIGGLLAAGVSGPLRLGYGTPRDWLLGMRVVLGDGRLVKSGGKVVKNVAGYDTHKLQLGALGTLGVIAEATFKVAPLPAQLATLGFACTDGPAALALASQMRARPLAPVSLLVHQEPGQGARLLARFAGAADAVARQVGLAMAAAQAHGATPTDPAQAEAAWQALALFARPARQDAGETVIVRAGAPPSALPDVWAALAQAVPTGYSATSLAYAGVGLAFVRWSAAAADPPAVAAALAGLRARLAEIQGYAVLEDAGPGTRAASDLWGPPPPTFGLMRALKARWDPRGVLNRGRYLGGI